MSTDDFTIEEGLMEELGNLGRDVAQAIPRYDTKIDGKHKRIRNAAQGVSVIIQREEDEIGDLEEKKEQAEEILARAERLINWRSEPEPTPEPPADVTPPVVLPTPPVVEPEPAPVVVIEPEPEPVPDETAEQPAIVVVERRSLDPRGWSGLQWLCAAIGLVIGLLVSNGTYGDAGSNISGDWSWVFTLLWFVAVCGIGFFGGGFIGSLIEERLARRNNR